MVVWTTYDSVNNNNNDIQHVKTSHHIETLNLKSVDAASLAAVHVVSESQDYLNKTRQNYFKFTFLTAGKAKPNVIISTKVKAERSAVRMVNYN